jgi:hypothetical protein
MKSMHQSPARTLVFKLREYTPTYFFKIRFNIIFAHTLQIPNISDETVPSVLQLIYPQWHFVNYNTGHSGMK